MKRTAIYPGIKESVILIFFLFLIQLLGGTFLSILSTTFKLEPFQKDYTFAIVLTVFSFYSVTFWGFKSTRLSFPEVFKLGRFDVAILPSTLLMVFGLNVICSELDNVLRYFFPMPGSMRTLFGSLYSGEYKAMVLLVVIAPFAEEFLFRGLILNGFLSQYNAKKAVVWSALLFMMIHLNPYQYTSSFLVGLFSACLFLICRSLWMCIIFHSAFNAIPFVFQGMLQLHVTGYTFPEQQQTIGQFHPFWFDLLGIVALLVGIYYTTKITTRNKVMISDEFGN